MARTLLVSHRLPFSVAIQDAHHYTLESSVGGLATGLMPLLRANNLWLGWNGTNEKLTNVMDNEIRSEFKEQGCVPIEFAEEDHHPFLDDMCNGVLWPLYHYQVGNLPLQLNGWEEYERINRRTTEAIAANVKPGDLVWIHDYHFQLVPSMLREMDLEIKIGFFLHIPFPSHEIFRILPWRKEVVKGLLGADLIGFHTDEYAEHFIASAKHILNVEHSEDTIFLVDRQVQIGSFPLGVDPVELGKEYTAESQLADSLHKVRQDHPELKILLSVDRLDYTKGLARKLLAFEYLLENTPSLRGRLMLIQIAPPSRGDVPAYLKFRRQLDEHVGRINGKFATPAYQPIFYVTRSFHPQEIYQIYKDVDVMLVTPVRDGMNLVAKEFIAARDDDDGVLVLSEFAGASSELHEALMINPYDIQQMASCFRTAAEMPKEERKARMQSLRARGIGFRTADWAANFLHQLKSTPSFLHKHAFDSPGQLACEIAERSAPLKITLDYDGTLFPIVKVPATAIPDQELRKILIDLAARCELHIVSGRPMHELKSWFAGLHIGLHAEHGAVDEGEDARISPAEAQSLAVLSRELQNIAARYPGTRVETKKFSTCFHYRRANPYDGQMSASAVKELVARDYPMLQILEGKKTVEARFPQLHKGLVIKDLVEKQASCLIVAIGDDRTDEDMFKVVPEDGFSIVVGGQPSNARHRLRDSDDVRLLLSELSARLDEKNEQDTQAYAADKAPVLRIQRDRNADFMSV